MIGLEIPNPFTNARVVGDSYDPRLYHVDEKRGSTEFRVSNSMLGAFAPNPSRWINGYETSDSKAKLWGSLLDMKALQADKLTQFFVTRPEFYPDSKTGEPKKWAPQATFCREWKAEQEKNGVEVITKTMDEESNKAIARLFADERINEVIKSSRRQVYVIGEYHDRETGVVIPVKALLDLVPSPEHEVYGRSLLDLKSGRNGSHKAWRKQVYNFGWHRQAAFHWDLYVAATKEDRVDFRHIISENIPPYEPGRRTLSLEFVNKGRMAVIRALSLYAKCLKENKWPSYDDVPNNMNGWPLCEPEPWMVEDIAAESPEPDTNEAPAYEVNKDEITP